MNGRKLFVGLAVGLSVSAVAAAQVAKPPVNHALVATLVQRGQQSFEVGDMADARDAFSDALQVDPGNLTVAEALGVVYLHMEKTANAVKPLELAGTSKVMDRSLVLALASERLEVKAPNRSPMQVVKLLKGYLEAHPGQPNQVDETTLNALGYALSKASAEGITTTNTLFADSLAFYAKLNARLEATKPGQKRWGPEWMPAEDVDAKLKTVRDAQATVKSSTATIQKMIAGINDAQARKSAVPYTEGENNMTKKRDAIQKEIDKMTEQQTEAQTALDEAKKTLDSSSPHWPGQIPVDQITLGSGVDAIASTAKPVVAVATPPAKKKEDTSSAEDPVKPVAEVPKKPAANTGGTPPDDGGDEAPPKAKEKEASHHANRYAVAFAVAPDLVVVPSAALADAVDIEIATTSGEQYKAELVRADEPSGLTLLRVPNVHLSPLPIAETTHSGAIKCEGFPTVNVINPVVQEMHATLTGAGDPWTLGIDRPARLAGGPLIQDGKVVGVEMADRDSDPAAVPLVTLEALKQLVQTDANAAAPAADPKAAVFQVIVSR